MRQPLTIGLPQEEAKRMYGEPTRRSIETVTGVLVETWFWSWPDAMASASFDITEGQPRTVLRFSLNERAPQKRPEGEE